MKRFIFVSSIFLFIGMTFSAYGEDWSRVEKFQPAQGVYQLKLFENGTSAEFVLTRKMNALVSIRGGEKQEVTVSGLSGMTQKKFIEEAPYLKYKETHKEIIFDDASKTVEETTAPKFYDQNYSYEDFLKTVTEDFKIFKTENGDYKLYVKSFDSELNCKTEKLYLLELLILNLEDYIDETDMPPAEEICWTKIKNFNPPSGNYELEMTVRGTDTETEISADAEMLGRLEIKGTNSFSKVNFDINSGIMKMYFDSGTYREAKSLYKMAYGDSYNYDDENMVISGNVDSESLSQFTSVMTYKEFLKMGANEVYCDDSGRYKIVSDSETGLMIIIMTKK